MFPTFERHEQRMPHEGRWAILLCLLGLVLVLSMGAGTSVFAAQKSVGELVASNDSQDTTTFSSVYFVKTPQQLQRDFETIQNMTISFSGSYQEVPACVLQTLRNRLHGEKAAVELRTLMKYRAVVGIPFEDLTCDRQQMAYAEAASFLISQNRKLSRTQPCPKDFTEELYNFAFQGASCCNQYYGTGIKGCVRSFMGDSDASNVKHLMHRRWCLNPAMQSVGFGEFGRYGTMWSDDARREKFDYDQIAFPARGITPVNMLESNWAWHVTLNPAKYQLTSDTNGVKVCLTPAVFDPRTGVFSTYPGEVEIAMTNVSTEAFGVPLCVVFLPKNVKIEPGSAYCVEISGFSDADGNEQIIRYYVLFSEPL